MFMDKRLIAFIASVRRDKDVLAIILFGSTARGEAARDIDVCIALLPKKYTALQLSRKRMKFASSSFDVQIFQQLPLYIQQRILSEGKVLYDKLRSTAPEGIEIVEPQAEVIAKLRDQFRYNIMFKAKSVEEMLGVVKPVLKQYKRKKGVIVTINVDP